MFLDCTSLLLPVFMWSHGDAVYVVCLVEVDQDPVTTTGSCVRALPIRVAPGNCVLAVVKRIAAVAAFSNSLAAVLNLKSSNRRSLPGRCCDGNGLIHSDIMAAGDITVSLDTPQYSMVPQSSIIEDRTSKEQGESKDRG
jgi:hypothetical protein